MSDSLEVDKVKLGADPDPRDDQVKDAILRTRSPHPYLHHSSELLDPIAPVTAHSETAPLRPNDISRHPISHRTSSGLLWTAFSKETTPTSDSGTEADDEHFLKGLPAPRIRPHKGLRGRNEVVSSHAVPTILSLRSSEDASGATRKNALRAVEAAGDGMRRREIFRRSMEVALLAGLSGFVCLNRHAKPFVLEGRSELMTATAIAAGLVAVYPLRLGAWKYHTRVSSLSKSMSIPSAFDPAPLLYPVILPVLAGLLTAQHCNRAVITNLTLGLASLPRSLMPSFSSMENLSAFHWLVTTMPLAARSATSGKDANSSELTLLYPLHHTLCQILQKLTTTSLLPAELQLLSTSLIDLLVLASSPQAVILSIMLWCGGLGLLVLCTPAIRSGLALARVPRWRFRQVSPVDKQLSLSQMLNAVIYKPQKRDDSDRSRHLLDSDTEDPFENGKPTTSSRSRANSLSSSANETKVESHDKTVSWLGPEMTGFSSPARRRTMPCVEPTSPRTTRTSSGRRKRSASTSVRAFFDLTPAQATARKWAYAVWVYICIVGIILFGIRPLVQRVALNGHEPIGWALGYLFGNFQWFRLQIVLLNLEHWICLPPILDSSTSAICSIGWVQHLRHTFLGAAHTRLLLSAYWLLTIAFGLAVVFTLSPIYEVDTRRKVFHFMMVAMFLPSIPVDPAWCALALAVALVIFLMLDLIRHAQLPPLSKPIARFLAPYVDGRDLRGPVVISHIFLLIGCAIPLWLSLAALPRSSAPGDGNEDGEGNFSKGWEVPTRDVSMVAGVVCVGLGDAAASLIGRRWGHHKWLWGGGKSLEGSVAFAVAVVLGLFASSLWLRIGGWSTNTASVDCDRACDFVSKLWAIVTDDAWASTIGKMSVCAVSASLTEAVLTGGNDNVVVPVVLWTCVKALDI